MVVQGNITITKALFSDNISQGGSNGISAIGSTITANSVIAR